MSSTKLPPLLRATGILRLGPALLALLATLPAQAQSSFEEDFDDPYKPWTEIAVQLPEPPQAGNLVPLYVGPAATLKFSIDTNSLKLGSDGVVRYTIVAMAESGARNVIYEGLRCSTREKKQYAFGQSDGTWLRSRQDQWKPIVKGPNEHTATLADEYLCDLHTIMGNERDMLYRLRQNRPRSLDPT